MLQRGNGGDREVHMSYTNKCKSFWFICAFVVTTMDHSPDEAQDQKTLESEKTDLEVLELQKEQLSKKIERVSEESKAAIEKLDQDAGHVAKKVSDEADAVINYHRSTARKVVETINSEETRVSDTVHSLVSSIQFYYWVVALPLLAFGIVAGYTISIFSTIAMIIFPAVLVGASLTILYILHHRISDLRSKSENLGKLRGTQEEMTEVAVSLPIPQPDVASLQDSARALGQSLIELTTASSELVLNEARMDAVRRKEQFINDFSYALNRYGFESYQPEIQDSFRKQLTSVTDPNSWLAALLGASKRFFPNASSSILMLAYYDSIRDRKSLGESWELVSRTPSLRVLLAALLIRNKLIPGPNINESSVPVVGELLTNITSYSLEGIKVEAAGFFERLASFKQDCVNHLAQFDLNLAQGIMQLTSFMPRSASQEKWRGEVVGFIANRLLHVDENYIELLMRDAMGDASKTNYWRSIVKSRNLAGLATLLARKRLQSRNPEFSPLTYQRHVMLVMESTPDAFSLLELETNLRALEDTIIKVARGVERASQLYRLELNDFSYIWEFVPRSLANVESELLFISARRAQLKQSIFDLLYFSAMGSDRSNKSFRDIVESETESKLLSDFMVSSKFVARNSFNQNIIPLLRTQNSFDLTNFAFHYIRYEKLWVNSEALLSFLKAKQVSERVGPLNFREILKSCPVDVSSTYEDQMVKIATQLFVDRTGKYEFTGEQKEELALAATCLFLLGVGDVSYKPLCQKIPIKPLACKTVYRYINHADQGVLVSTNSRLDSTIIEAIEFRLDDPHFDYFKSQLASGKLPLRASDLVAWKINDVKSELKKLARNGFESKAADNYLEPMRRTLDQVIDQGTLRDLLTQQVLSAYTLTISRNHPVGTLMDSEDRFMEKSAHALAARKEKGRYEELIKLTGGRATRIGLIPPEMSFESFSSKFEEVLQGAVKLYNAKFPSDQLPDPLPCYLTRIFPSDNTLKEISSSEETEGRPLDVVRNLVTSSVNGNEGLLLLALLQPVAQSKLALRNVIEPILEGTHLHSLFADLSPTIGQIKEIQAKFESRAIDNALLESYNATRLSLLCKAIADQVKQAGEDNAKRKFFATMRTVLPEISLLSPHKREILLRTLFKRMSGIGTLFSP